MKLFAQKKLFFASVFLAAFVSIGFLFQPQIVFAATKTKKTTIAAVKVKVPQYKATLLIQSAKELRIEPNETVTVRLGFKNSGKKKWPSHELFVQDARLVGAVTGANTGTLAVGRLEFFDLTISAPQESGTYTVQASLKAGKEIIEGSSFAIPVTVVQSESGTALTAELPKEPRIRVAIARVKGPIVLHTNGDYEIARPTGERIVYVPSGQNIRLEFEPTTGIYSVVTTEITATSTDYFRIQPISANGAHFVVHDRDDRPSWNGSVVYNDFRDTVELRWSAKNSELWLVNELLMESYLKGLIETGPSDPLEFQKAVITAARSYAYVFLPDGHTYTKRLFDMHAVRDQVYKGYTAEKLNPIGASAVDQTRGMMVAYNGVLVVTPYFTRSDGRTRTWSEAWGGKDKPWLQSVSAVFDEGKRLWGHGVGMSVRDAEAHIVNDGWDWQKTLKYYYTGVEIKQAYQ